MSSDLDKPLSWVLDLKSANDLKLFICIHDVLTYGWYLDLESEKLSAPAKLASNKVMVISMVYWRQREVIHLFSSLLNLICWKLLFIYSSIYCHRWVVPILIWRLLYCTSRCTDIFFYPIMASLIFPVFHVWMNDNQSFHKNTKK